jgi:hypothetical protein
MKPLLILNACIFALLLSTISLYAQSVSKKPVVVFVTGDHEYSSEATMPLLAKELEKTFPG